VRLFSSSNQRKSILDPMKFLFGRKVSFDETAYKSVGSKKNTSWGLTGVPNLSQINLHCAKLEWQAELIRTNPDKIHKKKLWATIFIILSIGLIYFLGVIPLFVAIIYYFLIFGAINSIKIDLIKHEVAKKNGWLYDPQPNSQDGYSLSKSIPKLFKMGTDRYVDDQVWGLYKYQSVARSFHSGTYT
jgi:hypothetical protein